MDSQEAKGASFDDFESLRTLPLRFTDREPTFQDVLWHTRLLALSLYPNIEKDVKQRNRAIC